MDIRLNDKLVLRLYDTFQINVGGDVVEYVVEPRFASVLAVKYFDSHFRRRSAPKLGVNLESTRRVT
jgi:hypothetical protein